MNADHTPTPQQRFDLAFKAHQGGDLGTARRLYLELLEQIPRARHLLGVLSYQEGDSAGALVLLDEAVSRTPDDPAINRHRGAVLLAMGRHDEAARAFDQALALEPDHAETRFNLGLTERQRGHYEQAVALLRGAVAGLGNQVLATYELGLALHLAGRCDDAVACYRRTLALDTGHAAAWTNLGVLLAQGGDLDGAVAAYSQALHLEPESVSALNNLGSALMDQGALEEAASCLERVIRLDSRAVEAWTNLGTVRQRQGCPEAAITALRTALQIEPLCEAAHDNLAECLREVGRGDECLASTLAAVTALPGHWRAHLLLGHELKRSGDLNSAVAAYRQAVNLSKTETEAEANYHLGSTLAMVGTTAEAVERLVQASIGQPGTPLYARALAAALLRRGDGTGAVAACDRALTVDRFDQEALAYRALGLRMAGADGAADALTDPDAWITITTLPPIPGYDDPADFNQALAADLLALPSRRWQPAYQSIRGGTQTGNNIFVEPVATIQALHHAIDTTVRAYVDSLTDDPSHPFLAGRPRRFGYRGWSVVLDDQGYHVPHIHPEGWLSGAYYVQVPTFDTSDDSFAGCIEFGPPWADLPFAHPPLARRVPPMAGRLVLFPSYFWHGVRAFRSTGQRVTVAFDLLPLER